MPAIGVDRVETIPEIRFQVHSLGRYEKQPNQTLEVFERDLFHHRPGWSGPYLDRVQVAHVVVGRERKTKTRRLVPVDAKGRGLARSAGHQLSLMGNVRCRHRLT